MNAEEDFADFQAALQSAFIGVICVLIDVR
jgi:hypothetical protein